LERLHDLWLGLSEDKDLGSHLHHRDVVGVALRRMERDLSGHGRTEVIQDMVRELHVNHNVDPQADTLTYDEAESTEPDSHATPNK
jgi:hypothetical protein